MKKKIISIFLALNLLISAHAFADGKVAENDFEQNLSPVEKLNEFGIMLGTNDGNMEKERNVTRAEFVAMLMRIQNKKEENPVNNDDYSRFRDVSADYWAYSYINKAFDMGITEGYMGYFNPTADVKYTEGVKMIVDMLGYKARAIQNGGYPWGYMIEAQSLGINVKDIKEWDSICTREDSADLIFNAMNVKTDKGDFLISMYLPDENKMTKYYISPYGRDTNDGSEEHPWKTLYRAAFNVKAGSEVILEDGEYYEERSTYVRYSGTKDAPIIFRARNPLKAKIIYSEDVRLSSKFQVPTGVDYITLQDVVMTQEGMGNEDDTNKTSDIFYSSSGNHCTVRGNKFYHAYEEAVKFYLCSDILVENNVITDTIHESIDLVNCNRVIIRNNDCSEFGRIGFLGKGGTRNMLVANNYMHNSKRKADVAFDVGGSTDAQFCFDIEEGTGFEAYNTVYVNNIVFSEKSGLITTGFSMCSPKKAYIMNNIIAGTDQGYNLYSTGMGKGWHWNATVEDIDMKNNIFANCKSFGKEYITPINFAVENNIFYNTPGVLATGGNVTADPMFAEYGNDWHLKPESPAIGKGCQWPEFEAFGGGKLDVPAVDYDGNPMGEKINIGPYALK